MKNNFTNKIYLALLILVVNLSFTNRTSGQFASQYGFTALAGTYTEITGGTSMPILGDDLTSAAINIGFNFTYCGAVSTQVRICSNGWVSLNATTTANQWTNTLANLTGNAIKPALMPFWDDLSGGGTGANASFLLTGTAPNRVFTIQYKNWQVPLGGGNTGNMQVKLYETTNVIEYIYNGTVATTTATIGIADGAAAPTFLTLGNNSATLPTSTTTFTTSIAGFPASGQIYRFTPPIPCSSATGLPVSIGTNISPQNVCLSQNITLSLAPSTPLPPMSGISYRWQSAPTATGPWADVATTSFANPTYTTTSPVSTPLFYRCQILCNTSSVLLTSTPNQVIIDNPGIPDIPSSIVHCGIGNVDLLANPGPGNTIRWYNTATQVTPISTSNPYTTPYLTIDSNNTYVVYVAAVNAGGCEGTRKAINLDVFPHPEVDLGPDGNKCVDIGDGIVLDAGFHTNVPHYLWDDNSTSQVREVSTSGTYYVEITNEYNCVGRDTINFTIVNNPVIDLEDTAVCNGTVLTLDAGGDGFIYYWNTGDTTQVIQVNSGGQYNVFVSNSGGCTSTDTFQVTMQGELPTIQGIQVSNNGGLDFQFSAVYPQNVVGYKWDFGDGSPYSYQQFPSHTYPNSNDYIVVLKLSSTCGYIVDSTSAHIVGINQLNIGNDELTVYPNPANNGRVAISNKGELKMEKVEVYNILGQIVYSAKADSVTGHVIDLRTMASGSYTIRVYTDKGTVARKLEIIN